MLSDGASFESLIGQSVVMDSLIGHGSHDLVEVFVASDEEIDMVFLE